MWNHCTLNNGIEKNDINIPAPHNIPFTNSLSPYGIVRGEAFPLKQNLMKPYPGRGQTPEEGIFNYYLSKARQTSENAFSILAAGFQIYKHAINTSPKNVRDIVLANIALHDFLRETAQETYSPLSYLTERMREPAQYCKVSGLITHMMVSKDCKQLPEATLKQPRL